MEAQDRSFHVRLLVVAALPVVGYALVVLLLGNDPNNRQDLKVFGNLMQCIVPLYASAGLLVNAASPHWRRNVFWMLLALGCTMWLAGQLLWTYFEVHLEQDVPNPFIGDVVFFLHTVPLITALAMRPNVRQLDASFRVGYLDFLFLLLWWIYLYLFVVIPWQYIHFDELLYGQNYNVLYLVENTVVVVGLAWFCWRASGYWRNVYMHLLGAATVYAIGSQAINTAIDMKKYYTGSLLDLPLVASFMWFGATGFLARRWGSAEEATAPLKQPGHGAELWPARLAMLAILSLPLMALWAQWHPSTPDTVKDFRFLVTMLAVVVFTLLLFVRQVMAEQERQQLLRGTQEALENLQRLQTQFVQSERMASLGQLAAGAAHEINNPLTAILGFLDVLSEDHSLADKHRSLVEKIREQARRTKTLLNNLLSFARQTPLEKSLLDISPVVNNAVQLRMLDLRAKNIRIHVQGETVLPAVRCDANQMLQVFFNLISNAVDAMEETGGTLTVVTKREKDNVVIEFADTGPGIQQPQLVFDPFYTTKPVGKGTGLGLSICYGIVKEHGGNIVCFNRHQGGAAFRVELPAATAVLPKPVAQPEPKDRVL